MAQCLSSSQQRVQEFGTRAATFLAAAVSDFYIPWTDLAEHKLQSRDGALAMNLQNVPKCLGLLRHEWAPCAFHVSFKLETDKALLIRKAQASIAAYGMHCVVANMLHTRKDRCARALGIVLDFAYCCAATCSVQSLWPAHCCVHESVLWMRWLLRTVVHMSHTELGSVYLAE